MLPRKVHFFLADWFLRKNFKISPYILLSKIVFHPLSPPPYWPQRTTEYQDLYKLEYSLPENVLLQRMAFLDDLFLRREFSSVYFYRKIS